jgi:LPS O-antigen subunit length determinant protein (WzzB/FepE family)
MVNSNFSVAKKIFKHKKHIVLSTVIAMVFGLFYTFIIKPVYSSTAYVYPANLGIYGQESQTEQLLQFVESNEIKIYLIDKLNLAKHYDIDTTDKIYMQKLNDIIDSKIKISKTKYESIEIKASDYDADTAKLLVTEVINGINWLIEKEHREKYFETVQNSQIYLNFKRHEVDSTQQLLNELNKKYEVLNVGIQLKDVVKNQYKMQTGGGKSSSLSDFINMSEQLKEIKKGSEGGSLSELFTDINTYSIQYGKLNTYFDSQVSEWVQANNNYQKSLSEYLRKNSFVVMASRPEKPLIPSWPRRIIVMFVTGLAVFLLSCIYFIFIDDIKQAYAEITKE